MDEFDESGGFDDGMPVTPAGPADQDHQKGAQTLPATRDDVVRYLVNQGDGALEPGSDYTVDGLEVRLNQRPDFFEGHCSWKQGVTGGIHDEPYILADAGGGENGDGGGVTR